MKAADLPATARDLRSERLRLELPRVDHATAFLDSLNHSLPALRFISWAQQWRDPAWALEFCKHDAAVIARGEAVVFHAFEVDGGHYVGRIDLHTFDFEAPRCEIGYVADMRRQGRGLMREAALAVIDHGFAIGLARVHALSDVRNLRALHFAATLGMQREGVLRGFERDAHGALCDMVMFAAYNPRLL